MLPPNIELSDMETGLFNVMSREYVLKNAIDGMRKSYDYILIDCKGSEIGISYERRNRRWTSPSIPLYSPCRAHSGASGFG